MVSLVTNRRRRPTLNVARQSRGRFSPSLSCGRWLCRTRARPDQARLTGRVTVSGGPNRGLTEDPVCLTIRVVLLSSNNFMWCDCAVYQQCRASSAGVAATHYVEVHIGVLSSMILYRCRSSVRVVIVSYGRHLTRRTVLDTCFRLGSSREVNV